MPCPCPPLGARVSRPPVGDRLQPPAPPSLGPMEDAEPRPVGRTKDVGWQIGVSRTLPVELDRLWSFLTSADGLSRWLGPGVEPPLAAGVRYRTSDGTTGEIRSFRPGDRLRLTWQPPDRPGPATVQFTVRPAATGTRLGFHTERLLSSDEREQMRLHWRRVIDEVERALVDGP